MLVKSVAIWAFLPESEVCAISDSEANNTAKSEWMPKSIPHTFLTSSGYLQKDIGKPFTMFSKYLNGRLHPSSENSESGLAAPNPIKFFYFLWGVTKLQKFTAWIFTGSSLSSRCPPVVCRVACLLKIARVYDVPRTRNPAGECYRLSWCTRAKLKEIRSSHEGI